MMSDSGVVPEAQLTVKEPHMGLACLLGLCAGLVAWGLVQWQYPFFTVADKFSIGMGASNEARDALAAEQARVDRLNAAVVLAGGTGVLTALLSVITSTCCSLLVRVVSASLAGAIWGGAVGFLAPTLFSMFMPEDVLPGTTSIGMAQAVVFALLGAGVGFICAMLVRDKSKKWGIVGSSALGGAAGAFAFPMVTSLIQPSASVVDFISANAIVQLLWISLPMVAIAAGVSMGTKGSAKSKAVSTTRSAV